METRSTKYSVAKEYTPSRLGRVRTRRGTPEIQVSDGRYVPIGAPVYESFSGKFAGTVLGYEYRQGDLFPYVLVQTREEDQAISPGLLSSTPS